MCVIYRRGIKLLRRIGATDSGRGVGLQMTSALGHGCLQHEDRSDGEVQAPREGSFP